MFEASQILYVTFYQKMTILKRYKASYIVICKKKQIF